MTSRERLAGRLGSAALLCLCATLPVEAAQPALAEEVGGKAPGSVDSLRVAAADSEPGSWLVHGRTWDEQRFSPLDEIHTGNVLNLGLAWSFATGTLRGLESTPIVVDGVLYATGSWSVVYALDAATGREIWRHDPRVPRAKGRDACCDVVNRGVAVWKGRVYVGTIDGRLVALDAATGERLWQVQTTDPAQPYTITGAPRVVKGLVVIGNGGAEFGVRGYFGAYEAETGAFRWRFYTVPASREGPHEHPELEAAAKTWSKHSLWESGLGGTVWDSMAFDPALDLLYVGVGNASVYDRKLRSPGGGDNLFVASILAVRPDTGRLVWHYQTTPGDHWDYTATQHMILADLEIGGRTRKVLMQAPKNGFFYVLDRRTGELISAEPYVGVSWATHVDLATGRPVERPEAHWSEEWKIVTPDPGGGHSWHPMSFHPGTGLVYVPSAQLAHPFYPKPGFRYQRGRFNLSEDWGELANDLEGLEGIYRFCEPTHLTAWDPVAQKQVWRVAHESQVPAGVLSTAGGLVFQGTGETFAAYTAADGRRLWETHVGVGIMAPPVSYAIGGEQYVVVQAGTGGSHGNHRQRIDYVNEGRILAWKLGGSAAMPAVKPRPRPQPEPPKTPLSPDAVVRGRKLYAEHCARCHGMVAVGSGLLPDLRHSTRAVHESWNAIVRGGVLEGGGMASFADVLTENEADAIHSYVIARALHEPGLVERATNWLGERICVPATWVAD